MSNRQILKDREKLEANDAALLIVTEWPHGKGQLRLCVSWEKPKKDVWMHRQRLSFRLLIGIPNQDCIIGPYLPDEVNV
jgi:hypothetical protein